jgi:hypothetical protein
VLTGNYPHRQYKSEEGEKVQEQDDSFSQGEVAGKEDVEADRNQAECEDQQRSLPGIRYAGVRIANRDHGLDELRVKNQESANDH